MVDVVRFTDITEETCGVDLVVVEALHTSL